MREEALSPEEFRRIWDRKPVLRAVYSEHYERMAGWVPAGPSVEIGSGSGNLRAAMPGAWASDITPAPWLDLVSDAQRLPIAEGALAAIVGMDVLHHIELPRLLLEEATRVLRPGGRLVLVEPAITPVSRVAFKLGHPEPVLLDADPLAGGAPDPGKHPFDSNQAIPTLLVGRHRERWERELPLRLVHHEWLGAIGYPLSGGFRRWTLLPGRLAAPVLRAEHHLPRWFLRRAAFRLLMVVERTLEPARSV